MPDFDLDLGLGIDVFASALKFGAQQLDSRQSYLPKKWTKTKWLEV